MKFLFTTPQHSHICTLIHPVYCQILSIIFTSIWNFTFLPLHFHCQALAWTLTYSRNPSSIGLLLCPCIPCFLTFSCLLPAVFFLFPPLLPHCIAMKNLSEVHIWASSSSSLSKAPIMAPIAAWISPTTNQALLALAAPTLFSPSLFLGFSPSQLLPPMATPVLCCSLFPMPCPKVSSRDNFNLIFFEDWI